MAGKSLFILSVFVLSTNLGLSTAIANKAYQCKNAQHKITLQDTRCPAGSEETVIEMPVFTQATSADGTPISYDGLRPLELTLLERLHEIEKQRDKYNLRQRNDLALAYSKNQHEIALEKLKHKHAVEMFDKSYHHFYVYGAANRDNVAFPFSYNSGGGIGCIGLGGDGGLGGMGGIGLNGFINGDFNDPEAFGRGGRGGIGGNGGAGCIQNYPFGIGQPGP